MRAAIGSQRVVLLAGACVRRTSRRPAIDGPCAPVALPDLSRLEESVQAQLRERYAALTAKQNDPATPAADLATEYGEMGKLLLAAEFRDPAEAALLNAQALAPGDMRWPYYLGHLYRTKGDIPNATAAFERALRSAPNDVPTMIWLAEAALDQGTAGRRRTALHESAVASASLGRGALRSRTRGAGQKGLRSSRAESRAGAGARRQGVDHPLFAGDGVPRPGRPSQSGIASAATRHAADSARSR